MVLLHTKEIAGGRGCIAARGKGNTAHQIKADPHPPRVGIVEVGYRPKPLGETKNCQNRATNKDNANNNGQW